MSARSARGCARRRRRRWPLRLAASAVLVAVVTLAGVWQSDAQAGAQVQLTARFRLRATQAAGFVESYVTYVLGREQALAERDLAGPVVSAAEFDDFRAGLGVGPAVLLDDHERDLLVAPADPAVLGTDLAAVYAHLRQAEAGRPAVSVVVPSAATGRPVVGFAVPFATAAGRRVVSGAFDLSSQPIGLFLHHVLPYRHATVALVDTAGKVVAADPAATGPLADLRPALAAALSAGTRLGTDRAGDEVTVAAVAGTPWRVVLSVPRAELLAPVTRIGQGLDVWWVALALVMAAGLLAAAVTATEARRRADAAARTDPLTGVDNRRGSQAALRRLFDDAPEGLGAVLFDVDHFKAVNDRLGHEAGDAVLAEVAVRAAACLRQGDRIGRWGGEEFLVLLPGTDRAGAAAVAERLREEVAAGPVTVPGGSALVTVSVGVAVSVAGDDPATLLARADAAMYRAKAAGRDRVVTAA